MLSFLEIFNAQLKQHVKPPHPRGLMANICSKLIIGGEGYLLPQGCMEVYK